MSRTRTILWSIVGATIVAAAVTAAAGHASSNGGSQPLVGATVDQAIAARHIGLGQLGQPRVIVDHAAIARHRALGRLGQSPVSKDLAVITRHQALGRLPASNPNGRPQTAATGPSGRFPWKESATGFAAVAACLLIGVGITVAGRARARGAD
jgi:hypothetical protein